MSENLMNDFSQKFGDISSSNLVKPMKVFEPTKALKEFEKEYKKRKKDNGSKEGK